MNLKFIELWYSMSYLKRRAGNMGEYLLIRQKNCCYEKIKVTSWDINPLNPTNSIIINKQSPIELWRVKGEFPLNPIFELVCGYNIFNNLLEYHKVLDVALDKKIHSFYEDEWFIKSFTNIEEWLNRRYDSKKNSIVRIVDPYHTEVSNENPLTLKIKLKVSLNFIKKSTLSNFSSMFEKAFDEFLKLKEEEYSKLLPF